MLLGAIPAIAIISGLYGALHDQLSFSVSSEYFTRFKYAQFGFEPQWFGGHRQTVAVIGFLATWWFGAFIATFLAGTALLQQNKSEMRKAIVRGAMITLGVAAICALLGLAYGWWFIRETPDGWLLPAGVVDRHAFLAVGSMHNCSYGGGVLGLIVALTDMEWRRLKRKAQPPRTAGSPS